MVARLVEIVPDQGSGWDRRRFQSLVHLHPLTPAPDVLVSLRSASWPLVVLVRAHSRQTPFGG